MPKKLALGFVIAAFIVFGGRLQAQRAASESLPDWVARKLAYEVVYQQILKAAGERQQSADFSDPDRPLDVEIAANIVVSYGKDQKLVDTEVGLINTSVELAAAVLDGLAADGEYANNVLKVRSAASKYRGAGSVTAKAEIIRNDSIVAADVARIRQVAEKLKAVRSEKLAATRVKLTSQIRAALAKQPDLGATFSSEWPVPEDIRNSRAKVAAFLGKR